MGFTKTLHMISKVTPESPLYNHIVRILGGKVEGQAILLPSRIYEFSKMNFAEKTIVDSSHITGHYAVYGDVTIGHCKVSGILHGGTYAANALITSSVSGPMRAFVGTYPKHPHVLPEQVTNHTHNKSHSIPGVVESISNHNMADLLDALFQKCFSQIVISMSSKVQIPMRFSALFRV